MTTPLLNLATDALATHRLTRLVTRDKITEPLREAVFNHTSDDSRLAYLVSCEHCVSVYAGALVSVGRMIAPGSRPVRALTYALALSSLTGMIFEREDSLQGF